MFCPKCGTQNVETVNFCRSCGANLGNVSDALAGKPVNDQMQGFETLNEIKTWKKKGKPISYETAITKMFSGLAFLIVAIVLAVSGIAGGQFWWFWMLIPAFGSIGSGVAQYVQLKKSERQNISFASNSQNVFNPNPQNASLPPPTNLNEIHNLVNSGNKTMAIKLYRETYNVGLKEAKDAVEQMGRERASFAAPPNDYAVPPRGSIYDTGELTAPPSVTENTTRHLETNSEGETMTLPKK
ncbi:MAG: zinc-ribbon domain-containing protein [Acidobacteriota bacterium]|nr:zinc-ribbon domain-containing protein [Acidobacteriota bacterium]